MSVEHADSSATGLASPQGSPQERASGDRAVRARPDTSAATSIRPGPIATLAATGELRTRLVWLTLARLGVATVLLVLAVSFGGAATGGSPTMNGVLAVVLSLFAASFVYAVGLARGYDLRRLAIVQIALDLAAWVALVYVTGGPTSPLSFFFGLSALTAALVLGAAAARVTASIAIAVYGALTIAMTSGMIQPLSDQLRHAVASPPEVAFQLVSNVVGILLVTALGSNLATRLSRAGGALARVEASRADLAALHEDVLRSIPVALLTCTSTRVIDGANPGSASLFGVAIEALLGTPIDRWLPFLPHDAFASGRAPIDGDETLQASPSQPRVAYHAAPLYDRSGRVQGGLVVLEDRSHAESLREQVQRAERLAVLGRLAAGMAHEIRNPLGAISGCVELVREAKALADEDRALLSTVLREVARLNDLVGDMLAFAKPRPPERVPTDIVAVARDVVALANGPGAPHSIHLSAPELATTVSVDPDQMRQVVWNLVRNASQASPDGAVVDVSVRLETHSVVLAVADRGPGIPEAMRDRIFDVFYSEKSRGTGLGLAIVRQIADAHGAKLEVRSREGGGSEIAILLPS